MQTLSVRRAFLSLHFVSGPLKRKQMIALIAPLSARRRRRRRLLSSSHGRVPRRAASGARPPPQQVGGLALASSGSGSSSGRRARAHTHRCLTCLLVPVARHLCRSAPPTLRCRKLARRVASRARARKMPPSGASSLAELFIVHLAPDCVGGARMIRAAAAAAAAGFVRPKRNKGPFRRQ